MLRSTVFTLLTYFSLSRYLIHSAAGLEGLNCQDFAKTGLIQFFLILDLTYSFLWRKKPAKTRLFFDFTLRKKVALYTWSTWWSFDLLKGNVTWSKIRPSRVSSSKIGYLKPSSLFEMCRLSIISFEHMILSRVHHCQYFISYWYFPKCSCWKNVLFYFGWTKNWEKYSRIGSRRNGRWGVHRDHHWFVPYFPFLKLMNHQKYTIHTHKIKYTNFINFLWYYPYFSKTSRWVHKITKKRSPKCSQFFKPFFQFTDKVYSNYSKKFVNEPITNKLVIFRN